LQWSVLKVIGLEIEPGERVPACIERRGLRRQRRRDRGEQGGQRSGASQSHPQGRWMMMMIVPISVVFVGPPQFAASQIRPGSVGGLVRSTSWVGVTGPAPVGTVVLIADASVCVVPPPPPGAPPPPPPPPTAAATLVSVVVLAAAASDELCACCEAWVKPG